MAVNTDRIKLRLDELGIKPQRASLEAGLSKDAIRNILRGASTHGRSDTLQKIAFRLGCSVAYLMGETEELGEPPSATVIERVQPDFLPVRYEVGAGYWVEVDDVKVFREPYPVMPSPRYAGFDQWLEMVIGDSMDEVFPPNTLVHVVDAIQLGYAAKQDDYVIVCSHERGGHKVERSIKQISFPRPGVVELWPRSRNPRWAQPIDLTKGNQSADELQVEIVGKVIGSYTPLD